jgi:hypothetical protein
MHQSAIAETHTTMNLFPKNSFGTPALQKLAQNVSRLNQLAHNRERMRRFEQGRALSRL